MRTSGIAASLGILLTSIPCFPQATVDFIREVQPILVSRCHSCHGSKLHLGELRLDRKSDALRGGGSGVPAIVPHKSAESLLVRYVAGLDAKTVMPPAGPRLTPQQIETLKNWIDQGAVWPEADAEPSAQKPAVDHWAFKPRGRPVATAGQGQNVGTQSDRRVRSCEA